MGVGNIILSATKFMTILACLVMTSLLLFVLFILGRRIAFYWMI
jgi:hypothetical protein